MDHMIDDSERLKPCPFCGGAATFDHDDDGWNWIECTACGASTNARVSAMDDCKPLLLEQWNKRLPQTQQAGPVRLTEADLQECKRLADAGSPVPRMSWSQRLAFAIETAVFERNGLKPQAKPAYSPDNPPRLRRPDESVEAYREAMGWTANDQPQAKGD